MAKWGTHLHDSHACLFSFITCKLLAYIVSFFALRISLRGCCVATTPYKGFENTLYNACAVCIGSAKTICNNFLLNRFNIKKINPSAVYSTTVIVNKPALSLRS